MNIELMQKIIAHILEEPRRVDMGSWLMKPLDHLEDYPSLPPCGTIGCIAGWAVELSPAANHNQGSWGWSGEAKRLLGITDDEADSLFYDESWPDEFRDRLAPLRAGTPEYALVVADRVRYMMEHGE